jgi:hypothetical protein
MQIDSAQTRTDKGKQHLAQQAGIMLVAGHL